MKYRVITLPECTLADCPPGPFIFNKNICYKSEYFTGLNCDAYCESGEYFWGGAKTTQERNSLPVRPIEITTNDVSYLTD